MSFHLLRLKSYPIQDQLLLEEALLKQSPYNWCLINEGVSPAVVLGISGKVEELINAAQISQQPLPLIRRFSGGGTVVVDENTLFVTFICEKKIHDFPPYPEPIMRWTEKIYRDAFSHPLFALRENDYVLGDFKCGGNAQYIKKHRWLHHTSFLWDYCPEKMNYLLHPKKTPTYRQGRMHSEFLCRLKDYFHSKEQFISQFIGALGKYYSIHISSLEELKSGLSSIF